MDELTAAELYDEIRRSKGPTKRCGTCNDEHPIEAFAFKSKVKRTLHSRCREAQAVAGRAWYDANRDHRLATARTHRARLAAAVDEAVSGWLAGRACACGATDRLVAVGSTGRSLKWMVKQGWTLDDVIAELADAYPRCGRCSRTTG